MKTNQLELKYYHNIERYMSQLKTNPIKFSHISPQPDQSVHFWYKSSTNTWTVIRNFYEYYIDGQSLLHAIGHFYWGGINTQDTFFDTNIGLLGAFNNPVTDSITAKQLLLQEVNSSEIMQLYGLLDSQDQVAKAKCLEQFAKEQDDPFTLLYGCQGCGDFACGGIGAIITRKAGHYTWTFGEGKDELQYTFEENQYQQVLQPWL